MQKVLAKESVKLLKLGVIGLLLVIVLVLAGEQLSGIEALILGITPYVLYQAYCAIHRTKRRKKK